VSTLLLHNKIGQLTPGVVYVGRKNRLPKENQLKITLVNAACAKLYQRCSSSLRKACSVARQVFLNQKPFSSLFSIWCSGSKASRLQYL